MIKSVLVTGAHGQLGKTIELMAAAEGLDAHKNAVSIRLNDLNK